MSVLVIRAHKRFAVCRKARIDGADGCTGDALLIELSLDGCRVSTSNPQAAIGDTLRLTVLGAEPLEARVRWTGEGTMGLRFVRPLHVPALDALIRLCRGEEGEGRALRA